MTNAAADEYQTVLQTAHLIRMLARELGTKRLDDAITAIDAADAAAPILDPTLYRHKAKLMMEDREILAAVRRLAGLGPAG